eukprot:TRINITY_DN2627_c0_g1_i4.p1 TRINITY_DN2627_c0_g1~~TRINITY_DN2627_c0_g1_i4.p1  ORF type:complete len:654 (+),score=156.67 TRINITY_DN2627_c0_g1_i4:927-2888(+)
MRRNRIEEVSNVLKIHSQVCEEEVERLLDDYFKGHTVPIANSAQVLKSLRKLYPSVPNDLLFKCYNRRFMEAAALRKKVEETAKKEEKQDEECLDRRWAEKIKTLVARDLEFAINDEKTLAEVRERTKGVVYTRFPPEPNGFLHIGHAKAIRFNFMAAKVLGGKCYLRYDDTNPEKESREFINSIQENVRWLGYEPFKITHASEYFGEIYELAVKLIKAGKAYICEQSSTELQEFRKAARPSPYRERSPSESLRIFEEMRMGKHPEGKYCLRLKIDYKHANPTLRDPVAYRVKYTPHPHTGNKWVVYPTYDFTHCINDSLESITYSLCTLEFEIRRDLYYWILNALGLYKPFVWEYSRLNISHNLLSKRKLTKLVEKGIVKGWDDPRLLTIQGLARRGYTPEAINEFCDVISVTRRGNETVIGVNVLEQCVRKDLEGKAPRVMAVLQPLRLILVDVPEDFVVTYDIPRHPKNPSLGVRSIRLTKNVFIERDDFREEDHPEFYGLSVGKTFVLKHTKMTFECVGYTKDGSNVAEVHARITKKGCTTDELKRLKGHIHFISASEAIECETRLYEHLFTVENPSELPDFLTAINPISLRNITSSLIHRDLLNSKPGDRFQFERLGYFSVDIDSKEDRKVFNRIVPLCEKERRKALN